MSIVTRLFESAEAKALRLSKEAAARERSRADEAKNEDTQTRNGFWMLVVLEAGMQGNMGDNMAILMEKNPGADDAFIALLRSEALRLAQAGIGPGEQKARLAAISKQFTAEIAAKVRI
ncbi:MAG: hypothetical protein ABI647_20045 [Gemmatimonadota bacterium]